MQILLPSNLRKSIRQHLVTAGAREIGGILMGEDLGSLNALESSTIQSILVAEQKANLVEMLNITNKN